jgi:hypothetical protein
MKHWHVIAILNAQVFYDMSPDLIQVGQNCFCADVDPLNPPINNASNCYIICTSTVQLCGGFSDNFGNAYHVQGNKCMLCVIILKRYIFNMKLIYTKCILICVVFSDVSTNIKN